MKKQETLEEAIKREYETRNFNSDFPFDPQSFKLGAKWQQEQQDCCTPANQIKRYVDCVGCDRKPKQMSKETAVDYLFNELIANPGNFIKAYKQAKEMEKEEIKDAYAKCYTPFEFNHIGKLDQDFEQYYNETYKKEK